MTAHDNRIHGDTLGRAPGVSVMPVGAPEHRMTGMVRLAAAATIPQTERAPETESSRAQSRLRSLASLQGTAQYRANVLAIGCPRCGTPAGRYCVDSPLSGVRGFCGLRWDSIPGFSAPRSSAAPAAGAIVGRVNAHPNRHPMQHTRG